MKKILFFLSLLLLTACLENKEGKEKAIDQSNMDLSVNPGDNFFLYANGGWMKQNPIPDEYSRYGSFDLLAEENKKMVKDLIEEAVSGQHEPGSIQQKVGDFFAVGMDSLRIDSEGINPILNALHQIDEIQTIDDVQVTIAQLHQSIGTPLFRLFANPDRKNSDMMIANLFQGGLGLTDRDYYTNEDPRSKEIRDEYTKYTSRMFEATGTDKEQSTENARIIMKVETRLAKASMTRLERRDPYKTYNMMTVEELNDIAPTFDWEEYFNEIGLAELTRLNVGQPVFFKEIGGMMTDIPVEEWKIYLKWHLINRAAPYLSSELVILNFEFYGKFLQGTEQIRPRWKRVTDATNRALGEAVGQIFVEKHFPPEAKERMLNLVNNLKLSLTERIRNLDWMSEETKQEALSKLEVMNVKIGYPDKWKDYSALTIETDSYIQNVIRGSKFGFQEMIDKIDKPVDPDEWGMTPQTVNAYYNPSRNEIVFPAAILQPPFFNMDADDAVNYGAIGMVIGHEMTHGFDDQGRQYDKDGNLRDWWTKEDSERFKERSQVLVDQYDSFVVLDTIKADGQLTLGENIADLGGLHIAFDAFMKSQEDDPQPEYIDGFTPEQRFFLSYAHIWAQNIRDKEILRRTKEDVHSLGKYRVNGPLPNIAAFYEAFNISEEDPMYLQEEERASIW